MTERTPVVVGYNGSEEAEHALNWALDDARARGRPVRLVYGYSAPPVYGPLAEYADELLSDIEVVRTAAQQVLAVGERKAAKIAPDVEVFGWAEQLRPSTLLLEESEDALSVVLGSRGLGALGSTFLGSVGAAVAARAACPVVIVRGAPGDPAEDAQVVVGIDGLQDSQDVLAYAFDFADWHHAPLRAVLCWHPELLAEMGWVPTAPAPIKTEAWLSEALAGWQEKYPEVTVHAGVVRDRAVPGLVAASMAQRLLVVGSRGRHALAGTLLGSVSQGVLHHATCPVAIVPFHST